MARTAASSRDKLVLDQLRDYWATLYDVPAVTSPRARRLPCGPLLTAATPGALATAIWADYSRSARCTP